MMAWLGFSKWLWEYEIHGAAPEATKTAGRILSLRLTRFCRTQRVILSNKDFFFFNFNLRRLRFAFCQAASREFGLWFDLSLSRREAAGSGAALRVPLAQPAANVAPGVSEQKIPHSHPSAFQVLFRRPWRMSPIPGYCHQFWTGWLSIFLKADGS